MRSKIIYLVICLISVNLLNVLCTRQLYIIHACIIYKMLMYFLNIKDGLQKIVFLKNIIFSFIHLVGSF